MTKNEFKSNVIKVFGSIRAYLTIVIARIVIFSMLAGLTSALIGYGLAPSLAGIIALVLQLGLVRPNSFVSMVFQLVDNGLSEVSRLAGLALRILAAGVWFVSGAVRRGFWKVRRFFNIKSEKVRDMFKRKQPQAIYLLSYNKS